MEEGPVEKTGLDKVVLCFPSTQVKREELCKYSSRAQCSPSEIGGSNGLCLVPTQEMQRTTCAADGLLWTQSESVGALGLTHTLTLLGAKNECLPWTRWGLQRRWNQSQAEAYVSPDQENRWEANETPTKRIYRLHLLGVEDGEDSWRKMYIQCHSGAFKHSQQRPLKTLRKFRHKKESC